MDTTTFRFTTEQVPLLYKISDTIVFIVGVALVVTFLALLAVLTKYCLRFISRHPKLCCSSAEELPYSRYESSALARAIAANRAALIAAAEEGKAALNLLEPTLVMTSEKCALTSKRNSVTSQNCVVSPLSLCRNVSTLSADGMDSGISTGSPSRKISEALPLNGKPTNGAVHLDMNGNAESQHLGRDKGSESSDMPLLEYKQ